MRLPVHLFDAWSSEAPRLSEPKKLALFSDFDGTLAPIRLDPASVSMPVGTHELLAACVKNGVLLGIITGRPISQVRKRVGISSAWYAGEHGYEVLSPWKRRFLRLSRSERERMARTARQLRPIAALPGIRLEEKAAALALHYRGACEASRVRAEIALGEILANSNDVRLQPGRKVWEILPAGAISKVAAIEFIQRKTRRRPLSLYLGDDLADEAVFRDVECISILVGKRRPTAARYWLRSPVEVRQFLQRCVRLWASNAPSEATPRRVRHTGSR